MTTFELPGCVDMWTVLSCDQVIIIDLVSRNDDDDDDDLEQTKNYLRNEKNRSYSSTTMFQHTSMNVERVGILLNCLN